MAENKQPSQEQDKARKQMVKNESVSDLTYNLLLICLSENIKGQIHRRVSVGLSHLHGQTSTQIIFSNLQSDTVLQGWHILNLLNPCSDTLTCNFVPLILNDYLTCSALLNSISINLEGGLKFPVWQH